MEAPAHDYVQELLEAGLVALENGDFDTALERWNEVLQHDPGNDRAAKLVTDLNAVVRRQRVRPPQRSISADVAIVVDQPSNPGIPTLTPDFSQGSSVEQDAFRRLQELLGNQTRDTERLQQDLDASRREVMRLRGELTQRDRSLLEEREAHLRADTRLAETENRLREVERTAREREQEIAQEKMARGSQVAEVDALRRENELLRQELVTREADLGQAREHASQLTRQADDLKQELAAARASEDAQRAEAQKAQAATAAVKAELERLRSTHDALAVAHAGVQAELQGARATAEDFRRDLGVVQTALGATRLERDELGQELGELQEALQRAQVTELDARREAVERSREAETLRAQLAELVQKFDRIDADSEALDEALEASEVARRALEAELTAREIARVALAERVAQVEEERDRTLQRATQAEALVASTRSERKQSEKALQAAEEQLKTLRARNVAFESEVRVLQEATREVKTLRALRSELETQVAELTARLRGLERESEDLRNSGSRRAITDADLVERPAIVVTDATRRASRNERAEARRLTRETATTLENAAPPSNIDIPVIPPRLDEPPAASLLSALRGAEPSASTPVGIVQPSSPTPTSAPVPQSLQPPQQSLGRIQVTTIGTPVSGPISRPSNAPPVARHLTNDAPVHQFDENDRESTNGNVREGLLGAVTGYDFEAARDQTETTSPNLGALEAILASSSELDDDPAVARDMDALMEATPAEPSLSSVGGSAQTTAAPGDSLLPIAEELDAQLDAFIDTHDDLPFDQAEGASTERVSGFTPTVEGEPVAAPPSLSSPHLDYPVTAAAPDVSGFEVIVSMDSGVVDVLPASAQDDAEVLDMSDDVESLDGDDLLDELTSAPPPPASAPPAPPSLPPTPRISGAHQAVPPPPPPAAANRTSGSHPAVGSSSQPGSRISGSHPAVPPPIPARISGSHPAVTSEDVLTFSLDEREVSSPGKSVPVTGARVAPTPAARFFATEEPITRNGRTSGSFAAVSSEPPNPGRTSGSFAAVPPAPVDSAPLDDLFGGDSAAPAPAAVEEAELTFELEPSEPAAAVVPPASAAAPAPRLSNRTARIADYPNRMPRIVARASSEGLGAREAFVINNVDGSLSFADLFDVCGLPPAETERILQSLYEQGVIDFDADL